MMARVMARDHTNMAGLDQIMDQFKHTHPFMPLIEEIDKLKQTLCELDVNDSAASYRIKEHARRLQAKIPPNPGDISCLVEEIQLSYDPDYPQVPFTYYPYPLCRLLNKDICCPKEIPLSILELLVTAGLDVNGTSYNYYNKKGQTCLHDAIESGHFNAVRWLVEHGADFNAKVNGKTCLHSAIDSGHYNAVKLLLEHGADCNAKVNGQRCLHSAIDSGHYDVVRLLVEHGADCNAMNHKNFRHKTPIVSLASRPNVPLDLFDLLRTPENLKDGTGKCLPLYEALHHDCINSALYLISLGAEVNKADGYYECLPIECYVGCANAAYIIKKRFEFHEELFIKLLPPSCMNTFNIIHEIMLNNFEPDVASKMVYPLLQRHIKTGNISLGIRTYRKQDDEYQMFYLKSLLVLLLDLDVTLMYGIAEFTKSVTDESWKQAVIDIWEAYDQRHGKVKSLFKLCIQCTRKSMSSLDDDSFQSLPLPSKIQNFLKLRDVAEIICEAWKLWPKCVIVQDIVNIYL